MTPFLRWAGGKRWLSPRLAPILKNRIIKTYFEPFLGSGSLFFTLEPEVAILSDINEELINSYNLVATHSHLILERLKAIPVNSKTFYEVRYAEPRSSLERAVRFIYLNRTCYGGLHRTNRQGKFNTPYGGGSRTPEPLWRDGILNSAAQVIARRGIKLMFSDFEEVVGSASEGDLVYCDPIYTTTDRGHFDRYNPRLFGWDQQARLRDSAFRAHDRGALVVISNAFTPEMKAFYPRAYRIPLERKKSIGNRANGADRGLEYLIILDPLDRRKDWASLGEIERRARRSQPISVEKNDGDFKRPTASTPLLITI